MLYLCIIIRNSEIIMLTHALDFKGIPYGLYYTHYYTNNAEPRALARSFDT